MRWEQRLRDRFEGIAKAASKGWDQISGGAGFLMLLISAVLGGWVIDRWLRGFGFDDGRIQSIASWAQAFGAVLAVLAGAFFVRWTGEEQRKLIAEQNVEKDLRCLRALKEIFQQATAVRLMVEQLSRIRAPYWGTIRAAAEDLLEFCRAIPSLEVPDPDLIRCLALTRQMAATFIGYAERGRSIRDMQGALKSDYSMFHGEDPWDGIHEFAVGEASTCQEAEVKCEALIQKLASERG